MSQLRVSFVASVALLFTAAAPAQYYWETLAADHSNIRGLNFIPTYRSLITSPPAGFGDNHSNVAMWRFYDMNLLPGGTAAETRQQLTYLKGIGCNAIRVWLSYPVWEEYSNNTPPNNLYLQRLDHFLTQCDSLYIRVMPILWDAHCQFDPCNVPDYNDRLGINPPHTNLLKWVPNPGPPKLPTFAANLAATLGARYVSETVLTARTHACLWMWDIMNEPGVGPGSLHQPLILQTIPIVQTNDPGRPITVGEAAWIPNNPPQFPVAQAIDVLSIHPYGHFRDTVELMIEYAKAMPDVNSIPMVKPILATEGALPGGGSSYAETINYLTKVPWTLGTQPKVGIGFMLFQAMIGWELPGTGLPYQGGTGFFYFDGEVRDVGECMAFRQIALNHGVPSNQLAASFTVKQLSGVGYLAQGLVPVGWGYPHSIAVLAMPSYQGLAVPDAVICAGLFTSLTVFGLGPLTVGPAPRVVMTPAERAGFDAYVEWFTKGTVNGVPITLTYAQAMQALSDWRFLMLPHVVQLGGPYP